MREPHKPVPVPEADDICLTCGEPVDEGLDGLHDETLAAVYAEVAGALVEVEYAIEGATHSWEAQRRMQAAMGGAVLAEMSVYRAVDINGRPVLADLLAAKGSLLAAKVSLIEGVSR